MIGFLFVVNFVGLLALVPLRKIMVIDYKLPYPSGTGIALLINGFHTTKGNKTVKCYFDFSMTYVGVGMICSHLVNLSLLLGGVLSWGVIWPLISEKGDWFHPFAANSWLYFIGIGRNRYHMRFPNLSDGFKNARSDVNTAAINEKVVINIDMECFFVSVDIKDHCELLDKPVAVCHSDSSRGVKAGMFIKEAKTHP